MGKQIYKYVYCVHRYNKHISCFLSATQYSVGVQEKCDFLVFTISINLLKLQDEELVSSKSLLWSSL